MSDIERAARALIEAWDAPESHDPDAAVEVLRSALAHAARKEGGPPPWHAPCVLCGHRQSAHNTDTGPCSKCGCDCAAFRPTPPPATGEAKWPEIRDSGGRTDFALTPATGEAGTSEVEKASLPTRGDVGRPESTRDPVFLLRWRPKKVDPGRDRWHVEGVWFTRQEAEQFAKAHAYRWGSDQFGPCWHVYCVPADGEMARLLKAVTIRALPEAREGGRG